MLNLIIRDTHNDVCKGHTSWQMILSGFKGFYSKITSFIPVAEVIVLLVRITLHSLKYLLRSGNVITLIKIGQKGQEKWAVRQSDSFWRENGGEQQHYSPNCLLEASITVSSCFTVSSSQASPDEGWNVSLVVLFNGPVILIKLLTAV